MTDNLTQQLAERAEDFARRGGTELHVDQVLERAGEIRRGRRMRATLLMAACVLAIAVPSVLVAADRDGTHGPSPAPATKVDTGPLTLQGLKAGEEPRTGWVQGTVWHGPDGSEFTWTNGRATAAATVGKATLLALTEGDGQYAELVPPVSRKAQTATPWPMQGGLAVSPGLTVAAFVKPDGTPVLVREDGQRTLARVPSTEALTAATLLGQGCSRGDLSGCAVLVDSHGREPATWIAYNGGETHRFDTDMRSTSDVDSYSRMAGVTSVSDTGSCSALESIGDRTLWTTCDHTLLTFSPDAQHLLATSAYRDGAGDNEVAVLDSNTGKPVLDLRTADGVFVTQLVWEDDTHVLANLHQGGEWALVRIGLDGKREYAVPPVAGPDYDGSPFVLPTR
jgi:hypothetical protein